MNIGLVHAVTLAKSPSPPTRVGDGFVQAPLRSKSRVLLPPGTSLGHSVSSDEVIICYKPADEPTRWLQPCSHHAGSTIRKAAG
ncbi:hypothetical protein ASPBRDRAFT_39835 [Aspergillus brasiliensis CBS 101740]|uniref:Uncharacterized protein n=1 Tax=Aspergillus brasiliensis (strain CBS 101740 / IMI 381727 / IBT 21946) TaxID=767769 RepID=A0A1L9USP5_ASPBC|nr:hypothetical protein ASPBRDRAFT_39835 [Aspergillus brasiliensis CBS 101740]